MEISEPVPEVNPKTQTDNFGETVLDARKKPVKFEIVELVYEIFVLSFFGRRVWDLYFLQDRF